MGTVGLEPEDAARLRAFERDQHDLLAASYHEFFSPVTELGIGPLFDAVGLVTGMRLLDVATGPGSVAAAAKRLGALPSGVDLSPRMLELARSLHPDIAFYEADVEHLPFPDQVFDAVVCNFGIGHFPCPEPAVAECLRVLIPGQQLAFAWWDAPDRQRIQALFREAMDELGIASSPDVPQAHSVFRFCDSTELLRLLREAGLLNVAVEEHQRSYFVPNVDVLWRGGLGSFVLISAAIRKEPTATREAIRAALNRRATAYKVEGGLNLPVAFKIGSGQKPG